MESASGDNATSGSSLSVTERVKYAALAHIEDEEDSEDDRADSEVAGGDESEDAGFPGFTIKLDSPDATVGDVLRTTAFELNKMFDDVGLRPRGPGRPPPPHSRPREEPARRTSLLAQARLSPQQLQEPAIVRGPSTVSQGDRHPRTWLSYSRSRDGERPPPLRMFRRASPPRGRRSAPARGPPEPPQVDVRPADAGGDIPDLRSPDDDEPAVTWYGALVTLTTLGLGTWKLAAAYANEAAVAVNAVDWVLSVVLALSFFWLDRLCRSVRWLCWMKRRSALSDVGAVLRYTCAPFSFAHAWLKGNEGHARDEEGHGTGYGSTTATAPLEEPVELQVRYSTIL